MIDFEVLAKAIIMAKKGGLLRDQAGHVCWISGGIYRIREVGSVLRTLRASWEVVYLGLHNSRSITMELPRSYQLLSVSNILYPVRKNHWVPYIAMFLWRHQTIVCNPHLYRR